MMTQTATETERKSSIYVQFCSKTRKTFQFCLRLIRINVGKENWFTLKGLAREASALASRESRWTFFDSRK